jgi:DNA-binding NarL/FixJ family response regulator
MRIVVADDSVLLRRGRSNVAVAEELTVTLGAVEKHTQRIFAKLGLLSDDAAHRRVRAVLSYLRSG